MPENPIVFLEDIADKLEEIMEHWEPYLNTATGEFVALSDGAYIETDEELAEKIDNSRDYIRLPNQYNIHAGELPNVLEGEGFGIIEDCGGAGGLEELGKAFKKKKGR